MKTIKKILEFFYSKNLDKNFYKNFLTKLEKH